MHQPWAPYFLDLCVETGVVVTQDEGLCWGHCCLLPLGCLIFIALILQFANDIFKSSVGSKIVSTEFSFSFFNIEVLILLLCFEILKKIAIVLQFKGYGTSMGRPET